MTKRSCKILRFVLLLLLLVSFVLNFMAASVSAAPVYGDYIFYPYINPYFTFFDSSDNISFNLFEPFSYDKIYQQLYSVDYTFDAASMSVKNFDYNSFSFDSPSDFNRFSSLYVLDGVYSAAGFFIEIHDFYLFDIISEPLLTSVLSFYNGFRCRFLESVPTLNSTTQINTDWYNDLDYIDIGGFDVNVEYYTLGSSELRTYSYNTSDLPGTFARPPGEFVVSYEYFPEYMNNYLSGDDLTHFTDYFYPIEDTGLYYNGVYVKSMTIVPDSDLINYVVSGYTSDFCLLTDTYDLVNYSDFVMREIDVNTFPDDKLIHDTIFKDYTKWMGTAVDGFLQLQIAPNFTLGGIFLVMISSMLALFFLKLFAGG